jgi:hypothetical protein
MSAMIQSADGVAQELMFKSTGILGEERYHQHCRRLTR